MHLVYLYYDTSSRLVPSVCMLPYLVGLRIRTLNWDVWRLLGENDAMSIGAVRVRVVGLRLESIHKPLSVMSEKKVAIRISGYVNPAMFKVSRDPISALWGQIIV